MNQKKKLYLQLRQLSKPLCTETASTNKEETTEHNIKLTIATEKDESIQKFTPVTDTST